MATPALPISQTILKPVFLVDALGEYALLPDGAITNIGGVAGPTFTVGGRPLLFADGTTTDGATAIKLDFQRVYDNSIGEAFIDFTATKDFVLQALNDNQFRFDAETGTVTITGNLVVQGEATTVINTRVQTDRIELYPSAGNYTPFILEPAEGVTPLVNLVDIKVVHDGEPIFSIRPDGSTYIANLTVDSISGIDLSAISTLETLVAEQGGRITTVEQLLAAHLEPEGIKHSADQISADTTGLSPISGTTVQEVIESINTALGNIIEVGSNIRAYEHVQIIPSETWTINHGQGSRRIQITVWDNTDEIQYSDSTKILDSDTVIISYNTAVTGRAILMIF